MKKQEEQQEDYSQRFKEGDFLQSKNPYKGEHEKMVVSVNAKKGFYETVWMKGKHSKEVNFDNKEIFDFESANRCLEKVG